MDNPYVTYHNDYIRSVWWSLKEICSKDSLQGLPKIVPYCLRWELPSPPIEVAQGIQDVRKTFGNRQIQDQGERPLTFSHGRRPRGLSLKRCALRESCQYVRVKHGDDVLPLAAALCDRVLGEGQVRSHRRICRKRCRILRKYGPLFNFGSPAESAGIHRRGPLCNDG